MVDAATQQPGRILAAERDRQGLGVADIAQRLRMSVWQVEALEADDYSRLPTGPFLRGFVRNYAKSLGLVPEEVLKQLAAGAPREPAPRIVVHSHNIRFDTDHLTSPYVRAAAIATVAVTLGFAAMYWWLFIRTTPLANKGKSSPDAVAVAPAAAVKPVVAPVVVPPANPEPPKAEPPKMEPAQKSQPEKVEPPKPQAAKVEAAKAEAKPAPVKTEPLVVATAAPAVPKRNGATIKLRFKGKSWVEIKDSGGSILLTGLNDAGSETEVSGKPPFRVVVGNAPEVRLYFNDREFDLAPHMHEAVARVTIE